MIQFKQFKDIYITSLPDSISVYCKY